MPSHHSRSSSSSHHRRSSHHMSSLSSHSHHSSSSDRRSKDRGGGSSRYNSYNGHGSSSGHHHSWDQGGSSSVHDWTEHKSSSGKIYYYNYKTGVSQWDMPIELRATQMHLPSTHAQTHSPHNQLQHTSSRAEQHHHQQQQSSSHHHQHHKTSQQLLSASPTSDVSESSSIRQASPHSSISSSASIHVEPMLVEEKARESVTESLSHFYKPELIAAALISSSTLEESEQRSKALAKECYQLGLSITRVSAELKMTRSMVRFTQRRALVQDQKIKTLNDQIKELEPS